MVLWDLNIFYCMIYKSYASALKKNADVQEELLILWLNPIPVTENNNNNNNYCYCWPQET